MFLEDKSKFPGVNVDPLTAARENRGKLIEVLRALPANFSWDYNCCDTCALGLLVRLGKLDYFDNHVLSPTTTASLAMAGERTMLCCLLALDAETVRNAFFYAHEAVGAEDRSEVRPEHVAALLEAAPYVL